MNLVYGAKSCSGIWAQHQKCFDLVKKVVLWEINIFQSYFWSREAEINPLGDFFLNKIIYFLPSFLLHIIENGIRKKLLKCCLVFSKW